MQISRNTRCTHWKNDEYNCGLCDLKFKNIEELETHLNTCEVYKCTVCDTNEKEISAIKKHMENKHSDKIQP